MSLGGIGNLDYTVLLCNSMDETRAFYRDVMKFPIETDLKNWVSFRVGAALLTLRPRGPWSVCDDGKSIPGPAAVQLAFRVPPPAVDACHAELVAKGAPILRGPTDLPDWRHRTLFFRDPEDNIIEISTLNTEPRSLQERVMKAYLVLDFTIRDLESFREYIEKVPSFIEKHDGKYIVQGAVPTPMEGDWRPERMVILEFPARGNATAFLSDPEFQDLLAIRHQTTTSKLVLVDGCT